MVITPIAIVFATVVSVLVYFKKRKHSTVLGTFVFPKLFDPHIQTIVHAEVHSLNKGL
jgi:hypothetical protein